MSAYKKRRVFSLYKLINKINGHFYIGITSRSINLRKLEHFSDAKCEKGDLPIHKAIRKYGQENFYVELVETAESWDTICLREREEIARYKPTRQLYNAAGGGEGAYGIDRTYQTGDNSWKRRFPERLDYQRGDNNHMRRPEHRERMRIFNPAKVPGAMDCIKGNANPAKRPDVRIKLKQNSALRDPERRDAVRIKMSASTKGKPKPWQMGDNNVRRRPEERERIRGGGNPNAKTVRVNGIVYQCLQAAADALGIAQAETVRRRIFKLTPGYEWADEAEQKQLLETAKPRKEPNMLTVPSLGETRTVMEWSKVTGIHITTLNVRRRKGWTPEQILGIESAPPPNGTKGKRILLTHNGETYPIAKWSRIRNISRSTLKERVAQGLSDAQTLGFEPLPDGYGKGIPPLTYQGITKTVEEWSEFLGTKLNTLNWRRRKGWTTGQILGFEVAPHNGRGKPPIEPRPLSDLLDAVGVVPITPNPVTSNYPEQGDLFPLADAED